MKVFIYMIVNTQTREVEYTGSTKNWRARWSSHKSGHQPYHTHVRATGGWGNRAMIIVETVECETDMDGCIREQYFMDLLKPKWNKVRAYVSPEQKKIEKKADNAKRYSREAWTKYREKYKIKNRFSQPQPSTQTSADSQPFCTPGRS
jgi:predicted GIY-YIG superfamily endonuclease